MLSVRGCVLRRAQPSGISSLPGVGWEGAVVRVCMRLFKFVPRLGKHQRVMFYGCHRDLTLLPFLCAGSEEPAHFCCGSTSSLHVCFHPKLLWALSSPFLGLCASFGSTKVADLCSCASVASSVKIFPSNLCTRLSLKE